MGRKKVDPFAAAGVAPGAQPTLPMTGAAQPTQPEQPAAAPARQVKMSDAIREALADDIEIKTADALAMVKERHPHLLPINETSFVSALSTARKKLKGGETAPRTRTTTPAATTTAPPPSVSVGNALALARQVKGDLLKVGDLEKVKAVLELVKKYDVATIGEVVAFMEEGI